MSFTTSHRRLTGVLTLNTDFSATEVDDRQINLTRFNLFFPEKRDFFLQDVDIFSFGGLRRNGIPFFSRRIGLSRSGQPVDLDVGAKLTGRAGRWNVGFLGVALDDFRDVEGSNVFVGRVAANVLEESSVGLIVTGGDPRSNRDNSLMGADFRYRNTRLPGGRHARRRGLVPEVGYRERGRQRDRLGDPPVRAQQHRAQGRDRTRSVSRRLQSRTGIRESQGYRAHGGKRRVHVPADAPMAAGTQSRRELRALRKNCRRRRERELVRRVG